MRLNYSCNATNTNVSTPRLFFLPQESSKYPSWAVRCVLTPSAKVETASTDPLCGHPDKLLRDRGVQPQLVLALLTLQLPLYATTGGAAEWVRISPLSGPMFEPAFRVLVQPSCVFVRPMRSGRLA